MNNIIKTKRDFFQYLAFCIDEEIEIKNITVIKNIEKYKAFLKEAEKPHFGDCTKHACRCQRCRKQQYEIDAENMLNFEKTLFHKK